MHSRNIDRLFENIRLLQFCSLLLQLAMIGVAGWLTYRLIGLIAEKYLFPSTAWSAVIATSVFLTFGSQSVVRYFLQTQARIAARLDKENRLQERLVTYLEFRDTSHPFVEALCTETESRISTLSPLRASQWMRGLRGPCLLLGMVLLSLLLVPYLPVPKEIAFKREQQLQIRKEARKLEQAIAELEKRKSSDPELKRLLAEFRIAAREMDRSQDKVEALKKLNNMRTKLERYAEESSKSQAKALNDALQKAGKAEAPSDLSSEEQQELEKLISETQELMSQANSAYGQEIQQSLRSRMPDRKTLENMKKAMEDYKAGKAESEKALQNLEKSLANAQKGITSGTHKVVTDSTLTERELEKGKGGVDDGPGTTNEDVGPQHFDTKKKGISEYVEDRTKAQYEQLYQGQREKAGGEPLFLDGEWNTGEAKQMRMRTFGLESDSRITASGVSPRQQQQQESPVRKEKIPAAYQKIVKKYLESIQE